MTAQRARRLATLLRGRPVLVVEDDHSGDIASAPVVSLGRWLPGQTVHIVSFSKSHGPDLRLAAVGGAGGVVEAVTSRRVLGPGWSSRLLQAVLVELLRDPATVAQVAAAREAYAHRRAQMVAALHARQVGTTGTDGINLWVETDDEQAALVSLAAQGGGAAPGSPFVVSSLGVDHIRLTVGLVADGHEALADQVARACRRAPTTRPRSR